MATRGGVRLVGYLLPHLLPVGRQYEGPPPQKGGPSRVPEPDLHESLHRGSTAANRAGKVASRPHTLGPRARHNERRRLAQVPLADVAGPKDTDWRTAARHVVDGDEPRRPAKVIPDISRVARREALQLAHGPGDIAPNRNAVYDDNTAPGRLAHALSVPAACSTRHPQDRGSPITRSSGKPLRLLASLRR